MPLRLSVAGLSDAGLNESEDRLRQAVMVARPSSSEEQHMLLPRFLPDRDPGALSWEDLGHGAPTIIALARLCSSAMVEGHPSATELSDEAKAILYAARDLGVIEIRATNVAFDAVDRFLVVCVATASAQGEIVFKDSGDPTQTIRFLEGFRQLCACGLVIHHLYREFSLNARGFQLARSLDPQQVQPLLRLIMDGDFDTF